MCKYVKRRELSGENKPKSIFNEWVIKVREEIRRKYKIRFECNLIGSGSRNMVVRNCNCLDYFDLDYQIVIKRNPDELSPKVIKDAFRNAFNRYKPIGFNDCKDRSQSLRTKNNDCGYGFDIIITRFDESNKFYILFNKKDTNDANNNDYSWEPRKDMSECRKRYDVVKNDKKMRAYLKKLYLEKRHSYKDQTEPKKKSYQILNEAVVETLKHFNKSI